MLSFGMHDGVTNDSFEAIPGFVVTPTVSSALEQDRIAIPTAVQRAAIGPIIEGHNVVLASGTGTGKTLAYLLPILQRLTAAPASRAVCFAPATELAIQVLRVAERYKGSGIDAAAVVSAGNRRLQASRLHKSTRLIVGTPGRLLELYEKRQLRGVTTVVLDEPEPILAGEGAEFLVEVLSRPDPRAQIILSGATFGGLSERFIRHSMGAGVVRIRVNDDPLRTRIAHRAVWARHAGEKDVLLARFIARHRCTRAIVFVNQSHLIRHLHRTLEEQNIVCVTVSQERTKTQCQQALADFSRGRAQVLLTTDRAATGLDVPGVDWVLHFELPSSANAYAHRAGRTGRAGRAGTSVAFVSDADKIPLRRLQKELGLELDRTGSH